MRLEKYLLDHFMVRGINHFVPHAFSGKDYPDPDCPPHFYAHGNNPQYRHFGALMAYGNRVLELINGGRHIAPAAILYHGESDWMGETMASDIVGHPFYDDQIDYDYIPQDVFLEENAYDMETVSYTHLICRFTIMRRMPECAEIMYIFVRQSVGRTAIIIGRKIL